MDTGDQGEGIFLAMFAGTMFMATGEAGSFIPTGAVGGFIPTGTAEGIANCGTEGSWFIELGAYEEDWLIGY